MARTSAHLRFAAPLVAAATLSTAAAHADPCETYAVSERGGVSQRTENCAASERKAEPSAQAGPLLAAPDPVEEAHFFGVRGTETWTNDSRDGGRTLSATAAVRHFDYDARPLFSGRSVGNAFIGGGSAGFEGGIAGAFGAGIRAPFGKRHGLVARLGAEGYLLGNDRFYASSLELPQGQLGYQVLTRAVLFELTGTTGPVLTSRYRSGPGQNQAPRGLLETGVRLGAGLRHVHLELGYSRYEPRTATLAWTLNRFAGSLCGMAGGVGVCADMEIFDLGSFGLGGARGETAYLGLQIGVLTGQRTHAKSPAKPNPARAPAKSRRTAGLPARSPAR